MKKLTLLFTLALVLLAVSICSAQAPTFPYVFTGSPMTCAPVADCLNYAYIPLGSYGAVYENATITCFSAPPWAQGYQLNMFVQVADVCTRTNTLLEAYFGTDSQWYYAPGNPYATNNVIYAARLDGIGAVYAILANSSYLLGREFLYQDCYTGSQYESGGAGGTC